MQTPANLPVPHASQPPVIADLFCGVGGLSLGFQQAGLPVALGLDWWEPACAVYRMNHPHELIRQDLAETDQVIALLKARGVTGVIGGPPCQDFSAAGSRVEQGRASLTGAYGKIIVGVRPAWFVMENVPRAAKSKAFQGFTQEVLEAGYRLTETLLDASLCGVPQRRIRLIVVGVLDGEPGELLPYLQKRLSAKPRTMRAHFGTSLGTEYYYRHPRNYSRRAIYGLDEPSATIRGVNRPIAPNYPGHPLDAAHKSLARPLTANERALTQSFPASYQWAGTKTAVEQMIGNAVPPNLGRVVGLALKEWLKTRPYSISE